MGHCIIEKLSSSSLASCSPVFLLFLLFLATAASAQTQPSNSAQPRPVRIWCERGKSIEIPLRADIRTATALQYAVSTEPKYGSLGPIAVQNEYNSSVTYTHSTGMGDRDTFKFMARAYGSTYSQPAEVEILFKEPPVDPVVPETVDFGKAGVGGKSIRQIKVGNNGGAGSIKIETSKPWKPLSATAWLSAGEGTAIEVAFEPTTLGEAKGVLRILTKENKILSIAVRGEGSEAFDVERTADTADSWTIANYSDTDLSLTLTTPEGLKIPATLLLPPHSNVPFVVRRLAGWNGAITGDIVINGGGLTRKIPVDMSAIPARISLTPTEIDFGIISSGEETHAELTVSNTGGNPAFLTATLPTGMRIAPALGTTSIAPGEKQTLKIHYRGGEKSTHGKVTLSERDGATAAFAWEVTILPIAPPKTEAPVPPNVITHSNDPLKPAAPTDIAATAIAHNRVRITWQEPAARPANYRVEYCIVERPDEGDSIEQHWTIWKNTDITRTGDRLTAELTRLFPRTTYSLRVMSIDASGRASDPSQIITATTPRR